MGNLLNAETMLREAERTTGFADWGDDIFRHPFELLISDLNAEAQLTELGVRRTHRRLFDTLCSRLSLVEDRKRRPEIARECVEEPIFVLGLPRSGTTFFHNLLGADPANRSPMTWEILYPSPPPEESTFWSDPRITAAEEALLFEGFMESELQAIHPFNARRPEECNFIWELSFLTVNYGAWWHVPNYAAYFHSLDLRPVYEEERRVLQHLQHRFRRDRWVLKTPAHNASIEALLEVFPDAHFVQCHRDPAKIIPSLANNLVVWRRTFSEVVPRGEFGMLDLQARNLDRVAAVRARPGMEARFFDAHFLEVQRDPIGAVERCYEHFSLPLTRRRLTAIRAWMEQDREKHTKGPRHRYSLSDIDLDYASIDAAMGAYIERYSVQLER